MTKRYDIESIYKQLSIDLNNHRLLHTKGVAKTAVELAKIYNVDEEAAMIAGLLHDCAKFMSNEQMLSLIKDNNIELTEIELINPALLHAKAGFIYAQKKYMINDNDILMAIKYHTTGRIDMSVLEKIIYIADYIEPNRPNIEGLDVIRKEAKYNLDRTIYLIMRNTIDYLIKTNTPIDITTYQTCDFYSKYL